jgi:hypothetical protein
MEIRLAFGTILGPMAYARSALRLPSMLSLREKLGTSGSQSTMMLGSYILTFSRASRSKTSKNLPCFGNITRKSLSKTMCRTLLFGSSPRTGHTLARWPKRRNSPEPSALPWRWSFGRLGRPQNASFSPGLSYKIGFGRRTALRDAGGLMGGFAPFVVAMTSRRPIFYSNAASPFVFGL